MFLSVKKMFFLLNPFVVPLKISQATPMSLVTGAVIVSPYSLIAMPVVAGLVYLGLNLIWT